MEDSKFAEDMEEILLALQTPAKSLATHPKATELPVMKIERDPVQFTVLQDTTQNHQYNELDVNQCHYKPKNKIKYSRKPLVFHCKDCNKLFYSAMVFEAHALDAHDNDKPYICPQCLTRFTKKGNMDMHIRRMHDREINYHCSFCTRGFFDKSEWRLHEEKVHMHTVRIPTKPKYHRKRKKKDCTYCAESF
eukprot:394980_1